MSPKRQHHQNPQNCLLNTVIVCCEKGVYIDNFCFEYLEFRGRVIGTLLSEIYKLIVLIKLVITVIFKIAFNLIVNYMFTYNMFELDNGMK